MIAVATTSNRITASVTGGTVQAAVSGSSVQATASAGFGPPGPQGPAGNTASIAVLGDVLIENVATGDVLRYSDSKWRNYGERNLVDGGNW